MVRARASLVFRFASRKQQNVRPMQDDLLDTDADLGSSSHFADVVKRPLAGLGRCEGVGASLATVSSVALSSATWEDDFVSASLKEAGESSPDEFFEEPTKSANFGSTRSLALPRGRNADVSAVEAAISHRDAKVALQDSETVAAHHQVFAFPKDIAAGAAPVTAPSVMRGRKLTSDYVLARTHSKVDTVDVQAVGEKIRAVLERYGAAVDADNDKGKMKVALYVPDGFCEFVVLLFSSVSNVLFELNYRIGNAAMLTPLNKQLASAFLPSYTASVPLSPLVRSPLGLPTSLPCDDEPVDPAQSFGHVISLLKSTFADHVLEGVKAVVSSCRSSGSLPSVARYAPLIHALVEVLTADENLDASVINASLCLSMIARQRPGVNNVLAALEDSTKPGISRIVDECRGGDELSFSRRTLARRYCVDLLATLCEAWGSGDAGARAVLTGCKGDVEDVLRAAQECGDARTEVEAKRGLQGIHGVVPAAVPWSLASTHVTVTDQTTTEIQKSVENALAPFNLPYTYNAEKFKFKAMSWTPQGFAKFVIRTFRPTDSSSSGYVVEVLRRRGSSFIVSRLFREMSGFIANQEPAVGLRPLFRASSRLGACGADAGASVDLLRVPLASENVDEVLSASLSLCALLNQAPPESTVARDAALIEALMNMLNPERPLNIDCRTAAAQALGLIAGMDDGVATMKTVVTKRKPRFVDWVLAGVGANTGDIEACYYKRFLLAVLSRYIESGAVLSASLQTDVRSVLCSPSVRDDDLVSDYAQKCLYHMPPLVK